MTKDKIFTLVHVYEVGFNNSLILLDETLLTISKNPKYIQQLVEANTMHDCYSVEVIPTVADKDAYTSYEVRKEFDESFDFDTHIFIQVTTDLIKDMDL